MNGSPSPPVPSCQPTVKTGLGQQIGQYELIRQVGEGGMGRVYEARHVRIGKRVAIKLLSPRLARSEEMNRRFLREGIAACQIGHPNIVSVIDVGVHEAIPYLVMELLDGDSLSQRLQTGRLTVTEVADLLLPVTDAVAAAHGRGVIHRDIKPANIILARTRGGRVNVKVVDFGISRLRGRVDLTRADVVPGTPCYMAPELRAGQTRGDPLTDQFALGVTLYESLAGEPPRSVAGQPIALSALRPDVPRALEQVVLRATHPAPERRFPDLRQLGAALVPFASVEARARWSNAFGLPASAPAPRRPARRRGLVQALVLLLLTVGVGFLGVAAWDIWTSPEIVERPAPPSLAPPAPGVEDPPDPVTEPLSGTTSAWLLP